MLVSEIIEALNKIEEKDQELIVTLDGAITLNKIVDSVDGGQSLTITDISQDGFVTVSLES